MNDSPCRVVLDIDLNVLRGNYRHIAQAVSPAKVIAVLKANAYGLGMDAIAGALAESGVAAIAVAELGEGRDVRNAVGGDIPVMLLGTILPDEIEDALVAGLHIPLHDVPTAMEVNEIARRLGIRATCHVPVDTGMGRLGMQVSSAVPDILRMSALPHLRLAGIYSHFPMAYQSARDFTLRQIESFAAVIAECERAGISFEWRHIANSDGINNFPGAVSQTPFTHVRTGINLYGSFDIEGRRALQLRSVLTLRARLAQVRTLPAGATVGYGATYTCPVPMRIGTVAVGYADGLPLALSNRGTLYVRGRACPILGRVSMDYTTVSLDQVPDAVAGDEVVCLGGEIPGIATVEDWATLKGTHPYEVLCAIGSRVRRRYC